MTEDFGTADFDRRSGQGEEGPGKEASMHKDVLRRPDRSIGELILDALGRPGLGCGTMPARETPRPLPVHVLLSGVATDVCGGVRAVGAEPIPD
jgi:hypothetical protein